MDYIPDVSHEGEERKRKRGNTVGLHILKSSNTNTHAHASLFVTGIGPDLRALYGRGRDKEGDDKRGKREYPNEISFFENMTHLVSISVVLCCEI